MVKVSKKVPQGKSIMIELKTKEKETTIQITGDFFLFPEESITILEDELNKILKQKKQEITQQEINKKIQQTIQENKINIIGFEPEDLSEIIIEGLKLNQE